MPHEEKIKMDYQRPELEEKDLIQARMDAAALVRKYGLNRVKEMLQALVIENVKLTKEINEHRAARGIEPLTTYKV
jgi:phosphopantetheine adenylyltransferase